MSGQQQAREGVERRSDGEQDRRDPRQKRGEARAAELSRPAPAQSPPAARVDHACRQQNGRRFIIRPPGPEYRLRYGIHLTVRISRAPGWPGTAALRAGISFGPRKVRMNATSAATSTGLRFLP